VCNASSTAFAHGCVSYDCPEIVRLFGDSPDNFCDSPRTINERTHCHSVGHGIPSVTSVVGRRMPRGGFSKMNYHCHWSDINFIGQDRLYFGSTANIVSADSRSILSGVQEWAYMIMGHGLLFFLIPVSHYHNLLPVLEIGDW
jgi:hypothetical protein